MCKVSYLCFTLDRKLARGKRYAVQISERGSRGVKVAMRNPPASTGHAACSLCSLELHLGTWAGTHLSYYVMHACIHATRQKANLLLLLNCIQQDQFC